MGCLCAAFSGRIRCNWDTHHDGRTMRWWWRVGDVSQKVGRWDIMVQDSLVGDASNRLRRAVNRWWGTNPTHRQREWDSNQRLFAIEGREGDTGLGDVTEIDPDSVDAIGQIDFDQVAYTCLPPLLHPETIILR
jgi:hypothetical protein